MLNYIHPSSWPAISNNVIYSLVKHGPEQGNNVNVNTIISADNTGRKFTKDWFYVKHINGEMVIRKWLLYSINQNAIFCFPCILFGHKSHNITDPHKRFSDWRHLHPVIPQHENSSDHRNNYVKWKVMETNIRSGNTLDDYLINSIMKKKCHYNRTLKERIEEHKKGSVSYFSPIIQNEIIKLIGDKTRNEIISRIKKSKYYTILFDCTPDISKKEQMSQMIRYVHVDSNGKVMIEESFIDFIHSHEKTGESLTTKILNKLEGDKLDINDARGQGYDNGANMAGKYKGVRARISEINSLEINIYTVCSS
ncbi:uncharacterized protein LOC136085364 [Hydra vulgaris]|uniref:Uncharacterized protein LOC136085364 n=1 Tax=Hydra vulgaris TaxID=6087 RepID=A0ABM4CLS1_HYDVU